MGRVLIHPQIKSTLLITLKFKLLSNLNHIITKSHNNFHSDFWLHASFCHCPQLGARTLTSCLKIEQLARY